MAVLQLLAGKGPLLHFMLFVKHFGKLSTEKHCQKASLLFLRWGITGSAVGLPCEQVPKSRWEMLMEAAGSLLQLGGARGCVRRAAAQCLLCSTAGPSVLPCEWKVSETETDVTAVLKAQPPGKWMSFGPLPHFGAQLRSKLRKPSAC